MRIVDGYFISLFFSLFCFSFPRSIRIGSRLASNLMVLNVSTEYTHTNCEIRWTRWTSIHTHTHYTIPRYENEIATKRQWSVYTKQWKLNTPIAMPEKMAILPTAQQKKRKQKRKEKQYDGYSFLSFLVIKMLSKRKERRTNTQTHRGRNEGGGVENKSTKCILKSKAKYAYRQRLVERTRTNTKINWSYAWRQRKHRMLQKKLEKQTKLQRSKKRRTHIPHTDMQKAKAVFYLWIWKSQMVLMAAIFFNIGMTQNVIIAFK